VRTGVKEGSVSYLDVVEQNRPRMERLTFGAWVFRDMVQRIYTHRVAAKGTTIWRAEPSYRAQKFREIEAVGAEHGLELRVCRCNNLDQMSITQSDLVIPRSVCDARHRGPLLRPLRHHERTPTMDDKRASSEDALLEFIVAGTNLKVPQTATAAPSIAAASGSSGPDDGAGRGEQRGESLVVVGPGQPMEEAWTAALARLEEEPAAPPPWLLPDHANVFRGMFVWFANNKMDARAFLSRSAVRLEIPDPAQERGTACVVVSLRDPGIEAFRTLGGFALRYWGKLTPAARGLLNRVERYLTAAIRAKQA
jgi:hypothetical protein